MITLKPKSTVVMQIVIYVLKHKDILKQSLDLSEEDLQWFYRHKTSSENR